MEILYKVIWAVHVINVILLIGIVLLQTGKGSEVGFAFGAGAAQTMFGSGGGKTFLTRFTIIVAVLFMGTSITLALMQTNRGNYKGVMNKLRQEAPAQNAPEAGSQAAPAGQAAPAEPNAPAPAEKPKAD